MQGKKLEKKEKVQTIKNWQPNFGLHFNDHEFLVNWSTPWSQFGDLNLVASKEKKVKIFKLLKKGNQILVIILMAKIFWSTYLDLGHNPTT